jgi:hypothetical protein
MTGAMFERTMSHPTSVRRLHWAVTAALALILAGCYEHSRCRIEPVKAVTSPDGRYEAVVSKRYCKPEVQKILADDVNIRQVGTDIWMPSATVLLIDGHRDITTSWLDATHLQVQCPGCKESMVQWKYGTWEGISISYSFE